MTRFYYDTEFHERGPDFPIDFISIGVVAPHNGATYYAVHRDFDFVAACKNPWLRENVIKFLPTNYYGVGDNDIALDIAHPFVKSRQEIKSNLAHFFLSNAVQGEKIELWADYADYHHVVLCQIFGRMIDLPNYMQMYTRDIQQEADRLKISDIHLPKQRESLKHHSLNDACHNAVVHQFIMERDDK